MNVLKLYPQYYNNDRRQQDISVEKNRRSGNDRRINVDSKLRQDLKKVKEIFKALIHFNSSYINKDIQ